MKDQLIKELYLFCSKHLSRGSSILVGVSGGIDSICLLHGLIEIRSELQLSIHVGYVDHGWRKESREEALFVAEIAHKNQCNFHTITLDPSKYSGNKEAESRKERLDFFRDISIQIGGAALFLAHHQNDLEETVLQRIFEGSRLWRLAGIESVKQMGSLTIFRPLLKFKKDYIVAWVNKREIPYKEDATNKDTKFLRARMRTHIFPFVNQFFGKNIGDNLISIRNESIEIEKYFQEKTMLFWNSIKKGSNGSLIDFSNRLPSSIELRFFIKQAALCFDIFVSRQIIDIAVDALEKRKANVFLGESNLIYIDRGRLFFLSKPLPLFSKKQPIQLVDNTLIESWFVTVDEVDKIDINEIKNSWMDVWMGECVTFIPKKESFFQRCDSTHILEPGKQSASITKRISNAKVPNLFVNAVPCIVQNRYLAADFLLGHTIKDEGPRLKVTLKRIVE